MARSTQEELAGRVYDNLEKLKAKKKQNEIRAKQKEEASKQVFDQQKANKQEATFQVDEEAEKKKKAKEAAAARKSRATITGFTEDDQNKALMALMGACHQYDFEQIQDGLGIAAKNQFEPSETLDKAKDISIAF
eukprot:g28721.t1